MTFIIVIIIIIIIQALTSSVPQLRTLFPSSAAAEFVFTEEMRERLSTYSNAFLSRYNASTLCFCHLSASRRLGLYASWPAVRRVLFQVHAEALITITTVMSLQTTVQHRVRFRVNDCDRDGGATAM